MAKSKTSKKWMEEHVNDPYVKQAQVDGYRSRASYKLLEINQKDNIIRPGNTVMDLGSAPVVGHKSSPKLSVIAGAYSHRIFYTWIAL